MKVQILSGVDPNWTIVCLLVDFFSREPQSTNWTSAMMRDLAPCTKLLLGKQGSTYGRMERRIGLRLFNRTREGLSYPAKERSTSSGATAYWKGSSSLTNT